MSWITDTTAALARIFAPRARATVPETTPGQTQFVMLPRQTGGVRVTPEVALQISTVWACVSVVAKDIAASTWRVFREAPSGDRTERRNDLYRLLNTEPNPEMTGFSFRESLMISALLWGNGYAEIERDRVGRPVALWPLHPDRLTAERDVEGNLVYRVWNPVNPEVFLRAHDVFHIHGPGVEGLVGFDVTRFAATLFGHTIATDQFGAAFYGNGAHAGAVLETEEILTAEQYNTLREGVIDQLKGPEKELGVLITTAGAKWKPQAVEPNKAQFIETRQHLIEEIARWFDVPPHKVGHLLRMTDNNIEEQGKDYVLKITAWAERLRQEAEKKLVTARNIVTRIELDWLAEGNAKDKAEADAILVANAIQNRNEVRRRRGMNGMGPEGDKFTAQMAMTTLEKIGEDPPEPVVTPTLPAPEETDEDEQPRTSAALKLIGAGHAAE